MQIVFYGDNVYETSNPVFWEKLDNFSICRQVKIVLTVLSVNLN